MGKPTVRHIASDLVRKIEILKSSLCRAAQDVYDVWDLRETLLEDAWYSPATQFPDSLTEDALACMLLDDEDEDED